MTVSKKNPSENQTTPEQPTTLFFQSEEESTYPQNHSNQVVYDESKQNSLSIDAKTMPIPSEEKNPLLSKTTNSDNLVEDLERHFLQTAPLDQKVIEAISEIYDPEIPVNIYELGLIYEVNVNASNDVHIVMTLTSPACPVAGSLPGEVELKALSVEGVNSVNVELVFDPPWTPELMSEAAQLQLGFF